MESGHRLANKDVIVVGGSSGIGLAVARAAAELGARVTVASRQPQRAAADLPPAKLVVVDVTDDASVEAAFAEIGSLDHLVCTAAGGFPSGLFRAPADEVRALMESKFWGQYRCARAAAPGIRAGGSITLTSGIRSRRPLVGLGAFTITNLAVEGLARALALEISPIRVNAIAPGTVDTPIFAGLSPEVRSQAFERAARLTTVGRIGAPEEVAEVFLMSLTNPFLTGAIIDIDGGGMLG
jgi:NAD(P)-dependent dehydrogenase (short-subunit alcohol dehydrogenase family)